MLHHEIEETSSMLQFKAVAAELFSRICTIFLIDNNLLYKYQSGFLPHHSTVFQLIDIYHNICQAFDNNLFSCIVFCDVSKAFDRVWHLGLLFKLRQNGIDGKLLQWLNSYLTNRKKSYPQVLCFDFKVHPCRSSSWISTWTPVISSIYQ